MKRLFDVIVATVLLTTVAPLLAIIALIVAADGGGVLYVHERVGRDGKLFGCLKFRTMILGADRCLAEYFHLHPHASEEWQQAQKLDFDPRVTPLGRTLRRSSLDELPQLLNVITGNMSLVGPRPVTIGELQRHYRDRTSHYLSVRPGMTGLWQVSGRSGLGFDQRIALDEYYVENQSMWFDLVILMRTISVVIKRGGK
jgi:exopolysaccharide production protein ExoY